MALERYPKKPCKYCGSRGHFPYMCIKNPKNSKNRYTNLKQNGKYAKQWALTRQTWIRNNPPDKHGYWYCYLQIHEWCPVKLTEKTLTLDHVVSRSRAPSLRFSADNLKPACIYCNNMKGSKSLDQVKELPN